MDDKIKIPEEFLERLQDIKRLDLQTDVEIDIAKQMYDDAVAKYNLLDAISAKNEGVRLVILSKQLHGDLWALLREAVPATSEGRWTLDTSEYTVRRSGRNASSIESMLSSIATIESGKEE